MTFLLALVALLLVAFVWLVLDLAYHRLQARPWSARWIVVTNPEDDTAFWIDTWGEHDDIEIIRSSMIPQGKVYLIPKDWQPIVETETDLFVAGKTNESLLLEIRLGLWLPPSKLDPKAPFKIVGA